MADKPSMPRSVTRAPHVVVAACGGYLIYFGATAQINGWTEAFPTTILPATVSYLIVAGALLLVLGCLGAVKPDLPKRVQVASWVAVVVLAVVSATLGWVLHADATTAFDAVVVSRSTNASLAALGPRLDRQVASLENVICQTAFQYYCNDSPNAALHLMPSANSTDIMHLHSTTFGAGFRNQCRDQPSQVQKFGEAVASAAQYKAACEVCAQVPTRTASSKLLPWLCNLMNGDSRSGCGEFLWPETEKTCMQILRPKQTPTTTPTLFSVERTLESAKSECRAIAIPSTILAIAASFLLYRVQRAPVKATTENYVGGV